MGKCTFPLLVSIGVVVDKEVSVGRAVNVVTETFAKTSSISSVHFVYFLSAASKKFQCKGSTYRGGRKYTAKPGAILLSECGDLLMMKLKMINLLQLMVSPLQEIEK